MTRFATQHLKGNVQIVPLGPILLQSHWFAYKRENRSSRETPDLLTQGAKDIFRPKRRSWGEEILACKFSVLDSRNTRNKALCLAIQSTVCSYSMLRKQIPSPRASYKEQWMKMIAVVHRGFIFFLKNVCSLSAIVNTI